MKHVLVTGVSSGIGFATAKVLIEKGYYVFGSVRKRSDAENVKSKLGERFTALLFDVTKQDDVLAAAEKVKDILNGKGLAGLVNNAGIAIGGPLLHTSLDDLRWQLEVNVVGLVGVTQAFAPLLGAVKNCSHPAGKIINISSGAGQITSPFLAAYSASKHAVEAISHGFRREMQFYGVDVIIVGPGPIKTPIIEKFPDAENGPLKGTDYEKSSMTFEKKALKRFETALPAEDVGQLIHKILESSKPKTRYAILSKKLISFTIPKILPDRLVDKLIGKELGLDELE